MTADERKKQISEMIQATGKVKVTDLSAIFNVSEVTIRTDLAEMENQGLLSRIHGGAIYSYKPYYSMNLNQRLETNQYEKVEIAEKISKLINPNDTIMLNSGTTTLLTFRKFPAEYSLNIVTNSISIALEASSNPNYNVVLVGGSVNTKYQFTYGTDAITQLKKYRADKLILSVDGIDTENGFSTYYDKEADIDRIMLERSRTCIIAADSSKFNHSAFVNISEISVADTIVTNARCNKAYLNQLKELGIDVIV